MIVDKCVSCLQDGASVPQALEVLVKVLEIYPPATARHHHLGGSYRSDDLQVPGKDKAVDGQKSPSSHQTKTLSRKNSIVSAANAMKNSSRRWF